MSNTSEFENLFDTIVGSNPSLNWDIVGGSLADILRDGRRTVSRHPLRGSGPVGGPCLEYLEERGAFGPRGEAAIEALRDLGVEVDFTSGQACAIIEGVEIWAA